MFELLTPIEATLRTLTPRTEKHGEDDVSAVSLGLTIRGPNTLLDYLSKGLRRAFESDSRCMKPQSRNTFS